MGEIVKQQNRSCHPQRSEGSPQFDFRVLQQAAKILRGAYPERTAEILLRRLTDQNDKRMGSE